MKEDTKMKRFRSCNRFARIGVFLVTMMIVASWSWAAEQTILLTADKAGKGASGEVVIRDTGSGQKEIAIAVKGLKPGGVYTVWFVTMSPKMDMAGIGSPDYVIKIDDKGQGTYRATVTAADFAKWQVIEIAYHQTGDPKDMKHLEGALKGGLAAGGMGM
jgi:hypothetical protein